MRRGGDPGVWLFAARRSLARRTGRPRRSFKGRVNAVDVIVIVERVEKISDLLFLRVGQLDKVPGEIAQFRCAHFPAGVGEEFGDGVQMLDFAEESRPDVTGRD